VWVDATLGFEFEGHKNSLNC